MDIVDSENEVQLRFQRNLEHLCSQHRAKHAAYIRTPPQQRHKRHVIHGLIKMFFVCALASLFTSV